MLKLWGARALGTATWTGFSKVVKHSRLPHEQFVARAQHDASHAIEIGVVTYRYDTVATHVRS
jgi:hypothetical protein